MATIQNLQLCGTGHAIHNKEQVKGVCFVCNQIFCTLCQTVTCHEDGNEVHKRCAFINNSGSAICNNHGLLRKLFFAITDS